MDRPDLDEFLSALNGFLEKQTTPQDPGYLRFLEIFCRSVGSSEGHLLKSNHAGQLESVLAYGAPPEFGDEFNRLKQDDNKPSPLDESFLDQKVVALVELKSGPYVPEWFLKLMKKYEYKSLVAVPLVGHNKPVGILCAYYHDFCLFDQGTLDRLMGIGRMVGAATEKSEVAGQVEQHHAKDKTIDDFLRSLRSKTYEKLEVFTSLKSALSKNFGNIALMCGPVRPVNGALSLTVVDGEKIPGSLISKRLVLPSVVQKKLTTGAWPKNPGLLTPPEWGELQSLFNGKKTKLMCSAIGWQAKLLGAILVWRFDGDDFGEDDQILLERVAGIAALALGGKS